MEPKDKTRAAAAPTRVSGVAARLRADILAGTFPPGSALREIPIADKYGASRQTVREALRSLSDDGLVELYARRGARIPRLSPRRAREIYTLRALLEPFALRAAIIGGRIGKAEMDRIEQCFQAMADCAARNDVPALVEADMAFHWALCSPCDHEMLMDTLKRLQTATRQSLVQMKVYGSDPQGEVEAHLPILLAVRTRDADTAAAAMRDHISENGEHLLVKLVEDYERAQG